MYQINLVYQNVLPRYDDDYIAPES